MTHAKRTILPLLFIALALTGCAPKLHRFEYTRLTMGVEARIVLYAPGRSQADSAVSAAYARLAELDAVMSDYRADSELMRLCAQPAGTPVLVSDDLFEVIAIAQHVSYMSGGAFDITVGPLVKQWRDARSSRMLPAPEQIEYARRHVGWQHIALDAGAQTITLNIPGATARLDLGGIGKGYAAHQATNTLREHNIHSALVALAGDIAVSEAPPEEEGWRIVIDHAPHAGSDQREDPDRSGEVAAVSPSLAGRGPGGGSKSDREAVHTNFRVHASPTPQPPPSREGELGALTRRSQHTLTLANASISTSGSNQQFITIDGTRYSHIIDPRTGLGLTSETIVTVIARGPNAGALADALSSAACVLGPKAGAALVEQFPDCEAIISHVD